MLCSNPYSEKKPTSKLRLGLLITSLVFLATILTGCSVLQAPSQSECGWVKPILVKENDIALISHDLKLKIATHNVQVAEICK